MGAALCGVAGALFLTVSSTDPAAHTAADPTTDDPSVLATPAPTPPPIIGAPASSDATRSPLPSSVVSQPITAPARPTVEVERAPPWLRTVRETGLWSGPDAAAQEFVKLPAGAVLRGLDRQGPRTFVYFAGDADRRRSGEVWVDTTDLESTAWPRWVRGRRATALRVEAGPGASAVASLPRGAYVEVLGEQRGRWARAFYLGDGRTTPPIEGWIDANHFAFPVQPQDKIAAQTLDRATLDRTPPELWLRIPYRSQLDGTPYSGANCGPIAISMILDAFGKGDAPVRIRDAALDPQDAIGCDDCGTFIHDLAAVVQDRGVAIHGLRGRNDAFRSWTLEDIRAELRAGHPVLPQVMYRMLPGRGNSSFGGDHYIVVTGILGDRFIYNDPTDSDGHGYGRLISARALEQAMAESDFPYVAFAAGS